MKDLQFHSACWRATVTLTIKEMRHQDVARLIDFAAGQYRLLEITSPFS